MIPDRTHLRKKNLLVFSISEDPPQPTTVGRPQCLLQWTEWTVVHPHVTALKLSYNFSTPAFSPTYDSQASHPRDYNLLLCNGLHGVAFPVLKKIKICICVCMCVRVRKRVQMYSCYSMQVQVKGQLQDSALSFHVGPRAQALAISLLGRPLPGLSPLNGVSNSFSSLSYSFPTLCSSLMSSVACLLSQSMLGVFCLSWFSKL